MTDTFIEVAKFQWKNPSIKGGTLRVSVSKGGEGSIRADALDDNDNLIPWVRVPMYVRVAVARVLEATMEVNT